MRHSGRVVVITGAAQGMGEACARRFLDEGAAGLVLNDLDGALVGRLADELRARGAKVEVAVGSAADTAAAAE